MSFLFFPTWGKQKKETELQMLAIAIGQYYLDLSKGDYAKAIKDINQLGITKLDIKNNKFYITLSRPGILIGRRGHNIDALQSYLSLNRNKEIKIHIIEEKITPWLIPYEPYSEDDIESAVSGL